MEGIIIKGVGGLYYVKIGEELVKCKARGKFRFNGLIPMVGDAVEVKMEQGQEVIEQIMKRKNELVRPFVANVTQAFVIVTLKNPDLNLSLLNSFLILCEAKGLKTLVCFNKMDLVNDEDEDKINIIQIIKKAGYEVVLLNASEGKGLGQLKQRFKGEVTVFCGPSGVGKSTVLNKLIGRELMETGEISYKSKRGKHTTRHSELIDYDGGFIVDTPGFTSLDINFIQREELQFCFPEFLAFHDECKFKDCLHYKEPGCKIKVAVEEGKISKERYNFYIKTLNEITNDRRNKKW